MKLNSNFSLLLNIKTNTSSEILLYNLIFLQAVKILWPSKVTESSILRHIISSLILILFQIYILVIHVQTFTRDRRKQIPFAAEEPHRGKTLSWATLLKIMENTGERFLLHNTLPIFLSSGSAIPVSLPPAQCRLAPTKFPIRKRRNFPVASSTTCRG